MDNFRSKYVIKCCGYSTPCWDWTASKDKDGYGWFAIKKKVMRAHRASWILKNGTIPKYPEFEIDHLCSNRACVNPEHMEVVSHKENSLRSGSFAAKNSKKESCESGHQFSPENTYIRPNGNRSCRACIRESSRKYALRKKVAA